MIAELRSHVATTPFTLDLLDLIQHEMLIIETADRKRASCEEVYTKLAAIHKRCMTDGDYCVEPSPQPPQVELEEPVPVELSDETRRSISNFGMRLRDISPGRRTSASDSMVPRITVSDTFYHLASSKNLCTFL